MNLPTYIDMMLKRRTRLAKELQECDKKVNYWLKVKGYDLKGELSDVTNGSANIFLAPKEAENTIRNVIKRTIEEKK